MLLLIYLIFNVPLLLYGIVVVIVIMLHLLSCCLPFILAAIVSSCPFLLLPPSPQKSPYRPVHQGARVVVVEADVSAMYIV